MNRTSQLRRGKRRRKFRIRPLRLTIFVTAVIFILIAGYWIIGLGNISGFCPGVYVNGVSLERYTYETGLSHIRQLADDMLDGYTYRLTYQDKSWDFTAAELGVTMEVEAQVQRAWRYGHEGNWFQRKAEIDETRQNPVYLNGEIRYNEQELDKLVSEVKNSVDVEAISSHIIQNGEGKLISTPSAKGLVVDATELKAQIESMLRGGVDSVLEIVPEEVMPQVSEADLVDSTHRIAICTTPLVTSGRDRASNVRTALERFNNKAVMPGETVSFNGVVGKRTEANGFKPAPEFAGDEVIDGIGGGVCQASTTLYGAVIQAGMTVVERYSHSMTVGYVELSCDAAVNDRRKQDNGKDFVFKNDTDSPIYIYVEVTEKSATVTIRGKLPQYNIQLEGKPLEMIQPDGIRTFPDTSGKLFPGDTTLKKEGKLGARSEGYRVFYDRVTGEEVKRERLSTDYYAPLKEERWIGVAPEIEG